VIISFTPADIGGLLWFASNTDGERIKSAPGKLAAEGEFYASMLQNAGAYDGSPLGVGNFGFTGFDRIYATLAVDPLTTYDVTFQHAGDDRFGYVGDTSVVEVVDTGSNTTLALETFATPGLFDWQTESFAFSTGAGTTEVAIALTTMGSGNSSAVFDDIEVTAAGEVPGASPLTMAALGIALTLALAWAVARARRGSLIEPRSNP
jgi:hypothetical protein